MKRRIFHLIFCRLNFWLVWKVMPRDVTAAILAQRLLSTFPLRRSYREKSGPLGGSTDCNMSSSSSSLLSELGWREGCSWLTRNNDNQVLSIYLSINTHGSQCLHWNLRQHFSFGIQNSGTIFLKIFIYNFLSFNRMTWEQEVCGFTRHNVESNFMFALWRVYGWVKRCHITLFLKSHFQILFFISDSIGAASRDYCCYY